MGSGEGGPIPQTTLQNGMNSTYFFLGTGFTKGVENYIDLIPSSLRLGEGVGYVGVQLFLGCIRS